MTSLFLLYLSIYVAKADYTWSCTSPHITSKEECERLGNRVADSLECGGTTRCGSITDNGNVSWICSVTNTPCYNTLETNKVAGRSCMHRDRVLAPDLFQKQVLENTLRSRSESLKRLMAEIAELNLKKRELEELYDSASQAVHNFNVQLKREVIVEQKRILSGMESLEVCKDNNPPPRKSSPSTNSQGNR